MKKQKHRIALVAVLMVLLLLTSCGKKSTQEETIKKMTEIAGTVQAELTQVSALTPSVPPTKLATSTPLPVTPTLSTPNSGTPTKSFGTPTSGDDAQYDLDITIPDGSIIQPGATFEKTWSVLNTGTTTWTTDYQLIYVDGLQATTMNVNLSENVAPGETTLISVKFKAPDTLGSYTSWWQMYSASGYRFGQQISVLFVVGNETPTPTSGTATSTTTGDTTITLTPTP